MTTASSLLLQCTVAASNSLQPQALGRTRNLLTQRHTQHKYSKHTATPALAVAAAIPTISTVFPCVPPLHASSCALRLPSTAFNRSPAMMQPATLAALALVLASVTAAPTAGDCAGKDRDYCSVDPACMLDQSGSEACVDASCLVYNDETECKRDDKHHGPCTYDVCAGRPSWI